jgi:hypothetical protein
MSANLNDFECCPSISCFSGTCFTVMRKNFNYFFEEAIDTLEERLRLKCNFLKVLFWLLFLCYFLLSFILPLADRTSCNEDTQNAAVLIIFGILCFIIQIIEIVISNPLVDSMREMKLD